MNLANMNQPQEIELLSKYVNGSYREALGKG